MSRIPVNFMRLLKDRNALREFCFKPAGHDIPLNKNMPRPPTPSIKFTPLTVTLYRYEKKLSENTLCFKTKSDVSKPELKQYFKKLYGIEPKKISTIRFMGKVELGMKGYKKTPAFKKVYMELNEKVDPKLRLLEGEEQEAPAKDNK